MKLEEMHRAFNSEMSLFFCLNLTIMMFDYYHH
jgi:hypothetical protein